MTLPVNSKRRGEIENPFSSAEEIKRLMNRVIITEVSHLLTSSCFFPVILLRDAELIMKNMKKLLSKTQSK